MFDTKKYYDMYNEIIKLQPETIVFFNNCTEDEFYGIAEVFPDIIEKTQSREI